jgi:hypothetical protein
MVSSTIAGQEAERTGQQNSSMSASGEDAMSGIAPGPSIAQAGGLGAGQESLHSHASRLCSKDV